MKNPNEKIPMTIFCSNRNQTRNLSPRDTDEAVMNKKYTVTPETRYRYKGKA